MGRPRKNPTVKKKCKHCNQVRAHCTVKEKTKPPRPVRRCVDCEALRKKTARDSNLEAERENAKARAAKWLQTETGQAYLERKRDNPAIKSYQHKYQREWIQSERGREISARAYARARESGKAAARQAVRVALDRKEIVRPNNCSKCGKNPGQASDNRSLIEADHFKGYDPEHHLTIQWLCKPCHAAKKRGPRAETAE